MRYNKLIKELEYWKDISGEANPEVIVSFNDSTNTPFEIEEIIPSVGLEDDRSIGLII